MPWSEEEAAEAARRSAEVRRQNREKGHQPLKPAKETFEEALPALAAELVNAAMGRGRFSKLAPDKRLAAVIRALEFGYGRPSARPAQRDADGKPVPTPDDLFA